MKLAIYCRVSTDDQNIEQQRELLTDYCKKNNHTFRTYQDYAISGKIEDRPSWQSLLNDCNKGLFEGVLVTKYDRITRNLRYAIEFLEWLNSKPNLKLISIYDGEFNLTPDQIFVFKMKCLLSEYELDTLKWRSKIGIERAKKEGKYKYGRGRPKPIPKPIGAPLKENSK